MKSTLMFKWCSNIIEALDLLKIMHTFCVIQIRLRPKLGNIVNSVLKTCLGRKLQINK